MSDINPQISPASIGLRDAIHVPLVAAIAGATITAGQRVRLNREGTGWIPGLTTQPSQFAVWPFSHKDTFSIGEPFWLMLMPGTVTSLAHVWEHPNFKEDGIPEKPPAPTKEQRDASEAWLREFCRTSGAPRYEVLIPAALGEYVPRMEGYGLAYEVQSYGDGEDYLFFGGWDAHGPIPPEFWDHVEIATGKTCPSRPAFFSCSC